MNHKTNLRVLFALCAFLYLAAAVFMKPVLISLAKNQLEKVFMGSQVKIESCAFSPLRQLTFSGIEIKKQKIYDLKIKEAAIRYSFFSLLKASLSEVSLRDVSLQVDLGQKNFSSFGASYLKLGKKSFLRLLNFKLSNAGLDLKSKDLTAKAQLSASLDLKSQAVNTCDARMDLIEAQGLRLENAALVLKDKSAPGDLRIASIKYNKARIENVQATLRLVDKTLALKPLTAEMLGGKVEGDALVGWVGNGDYAMNLDFKNLDLEKFIDDFELKEKFQATGGVGGRISLRGSGLNITSVTGDLATSQAGGMLTITDKRFLENLARSSQQSLDILVESFKNYHYNIGIIKLGLEQGDLVLDVDLSGETGKRNLSIVVHNFKLRR